VNLPQGKNLVGTFYPPGGVFIDLSFLRTLPPREYAEGLAEVAKTFFLAGGEILSLLEEKEKIISREEKTLEEIVFQSLSFKKKIVEEDEREKGLRSILNYGHTIGHALERVEGYGNLRHGEAVALGMMGEAILGENLSITSSKVVEKQGKVLANFHLPTRLQFQINREEFFSALHQDKKKEKGRVKLVFLKDFGQPIGG
jgi:3-dehydroquinate synthase